MRKLIAVLCVVAMMMVMAVPAFANPSVTSAAKTIDANVGDPANAAGEFKIDNDGAKAAKEIVEAVNGGADSSSTPSQAVTALSNAGLSVKQYDSEGNVRDVEDLTKLRFSTQFAPIDFETDGTSNTGVKFEGVTADTRIMLMNPETGETVILMPRETAEGFVFDFPFAGVFALMDPITPAE